jgi:hypothetical protein
LETLRKVSRTAKDMKIKDIFDVEIISSQGDFERTNKRV